MRILLKARAAGMPLFLCLCTAFLFFCFSGCQPKMPPPPPQSFTATAQVRFGEAHFTAKIKQTCPGSLQLEFAGVPELEGMAMQLEGGTAAVSYNGMALSLPTPSLPQAGFAGLLGEALRQLEQPSAEHIRRVTDGWEMQGTVDNMAYTALVDINGALRGLRMPGAALAADLT